MFKKIVVKQKKFFFCFHFTRKEENMKNITIMGICSGITDCIPGKDIVVLM